MVGSMDVADTHVEKDIVDSLYSYRDQQWMCRILKPDPTQDSSVRICPVKQQQYLMMAQENKNRGQIYPGE